MAGITLFCAICVAFCGTVFAQNDPGPSGGAPRSGTSGNGSNTNVTTGDPIPGLTAGELAAFFNGKSVFQEVDSVTGALTSGVGLGPTFNMDSCAGCHAFPAIGGSSPMINPQIAVATKAGARNTIPPFITLSGPVREVRFVKSPSGAADGGVHDLFTITGRSDANGCRVSQPDFTTAVATGNAIFRIPTPNFGSGLIESIDDLTILNNMAANATLKSALGISGHENRNPNDGSLTRFGWKAQNKSLTVFAGEAYNVEQGVTNDLFPNERNSTAGCRFNGTPEDHVDANGGRTNRPAPAVSDVINFVFFMRFLAPPPRGQTSASTNNGQALFTSVGCALCHTPSMQTASSVTAALSNATANLYSDLVVHNMGTGLTDGITQGFATGNEFRTAPLWGLGQRIFFLHDGRTSDLRAAIADHASSGSEATAVVSRYNALTTQQKQDLLNFLRSL
ncbi:MAG TPA: di-heme oxidoredictase family protein [Bryobacteraceae bacterium]|nr:di-heme oxidoredictase family protein [Bryobacteraceae bacterium]